MVVIEMTEDPQQLPDSVPSTEESSVDALQQRPVSVHFTEVSGLNALQQLFEMVHPNGVSVITNSHRCLRSFTQTKIVPLILPSS